MKWWSRLVAGASMVAAVSVIVRVCGLEDTVFFNKSAASLGVFFLGLILVPKAFGHWHEDRRSFLAGFGLAFVLVFTEILGWAMRLWDAGGGVILTGIGVFGMAGAAALLAFALEPWFYGILNPGRKGKTEEGGAAALWMERCSAGRIFFGAWGIIFLSWIPCALAFYPGLYSYDMSWQWAQFASGDFTTHHPLVHTLLCGGIIELGKVLGGSYERGLFFHSLAQMAFLSGCMAFGIRFLAKRRVRTWAMVGVLAFFALFPFFPVLGVSTTKDTMFAGFFFVVFVCICDMVWDKAFYRGRKLVWFEACAVSMCLLRNNAVHGLAVMVCCLMAVWGVGALRKMGNREKKRNLFFGRSIWLTGLCILLSQAGFWALEQGLEAGKGSRAEMLSLPMQQMARAYVYHKEEFSKGDTEELLRFFDEDSLLRYKYYVSDPVKAGMNMEEFRMGDFFRLWFRLGRQFPGEYMLSPLYNMMGLWYLGGDSSCFVSYEMLPPFDEVHKVEAKSKLPWLKAYYCWFTDENLQRCLPGLCLFFYTSFYSWCVLFAAVMLAAKRRYKELIPPLFLGSYLFTLVFGPCIIVRYVLGVMMCVPVLGVMVFSEQGRI